MDRTDSNTRQSGSVPWLLAGAVGAMSMYFLDPQQGRRRVALARDRATRLARVASEFADRSVRDLAQRSTGLAAEVRSLARRAPTSDPVLVDRVRSKIGRLTSHPHAIKVTAVDGCVTLAGPVLAHERAQLVQGVNSVRGVRRVEDRLDAHKSAEHISALQGGISRSGPRMELLQENWAPGPKLLAMAVGTGLALHGFGRRSPGGLLLGALGACLAARAAAGPHPARALGLAGGGRAVDVQKTIHIAAPRDRVFDCWSHYDNFPRFMSRVEEVRPIDEKRSHWVVKGPAGSHVEWDSEITECVRPEVLAWRSEPRAPVQHAGVVQFRDVDGGTQVSVRMSYSPPAGVVGHAVASLFGHDPKHDLDADLMRMKSFIETGVPPHDAAQGPGGGH
jgi:uncharacterized membrane protein